MIRSGRLIICIIIAMAVFGVGFLSWVYVSQDSMIFSPESYREMDFRTAPKHSVKLEYTTTAGNQTSWYVPPMSSADEKAMPETLWILFSGNASLALHWSDHVKLAPDENAGFLMFEYPGYGLSQGTPSRATIAEAVNAAVAALAQHFDTKPQVLLAKKIRLLGYSLGAAVALEFATRHTVDRIVLAAPFTTMRAMADRIVKPHLSWLLRHRFNNLASLETIAAKPARPRVIITHGITDPAIPIDMSREMKQRWPEMIELVEVPNANHTSILDHIDHYLADDLPRPVPSVVTRGLTN